MLNFACLWHSALGVLRCRSPDGLFLSGPVCRGRMYTHHHLCGYVKLEVKSRLQIEYLRDYRRERDTDKNQIAKSYGGYSG